MGVGGGPGGHAENNILRLIFMPHSRLRCKSGAIIDPEHESGEGDMRFNHTGYYNRTGRQQDGGRREASIANM